MGKKRIGIRTKILGVFILLTAFFTTIAILNLVFFGQSEDATNRITNVYQPTIIKLGEFSTMVSNSKNYINSWLKNDLDNHPDKIALRKIHKEDFPEMESTLRKLSDEWGDRAELDSLNFILRSFQGILHKEEMVMNELNDFDSYQDFMIIMSSNEAVDSINRMTSRLQGSMDWLLNQQRRNTKGAEEAMSSISSTQRFLSSWVSFLVIGIGMVIAWFLARGITGPIIKLQRVINKLSRGELPKDDLETTNDEIGEMITEVKTLVSGLQKTSAFAEQIGNGELDAEFEPLSEKDDLGNSLISMRSNLKKISIEDERRNWANEGVARFSEILRNGDNIGLRELCDEMVSGLVSYLGVNQGWLYIVADADSEDGHAGDDEEYLELYGVYAYSRKKFVDQKILKGEGLTGQCWLEGEHIYMNDVPQEYVSISSGLGEATPTAVLIMPLKVNDEICGIFELASFKDLEEYQIEFVRRVAENIASTVSVTRINERTKRLLEESQILTENLKSQEEEMRQNFEELHSTQEEMNRREQEMSDRIKELEALLEKESKS